MKQLCLVLLLMALLAACSQQPVSDNLEVQWNTWQKLGGALDFTAEKTPYAAQLSLDRTDKPIVASIEDDKKGGRKLVLQRWTGSIWQDFVPTLIVPMNGTTYLDIQLDTKNRPVALVNAGGSARGNPDLEDTAVYRYEYGSWKRLGEPFDAGDLAIAPNGNIYALFSNGIRDGVKDKSFIKRWTGSSWQTEYTFQKITTKNYYFGTPLPAPIAHAATSLRFTKTNKPVVTWWLTSDEWLPSAVTPPTQLEIWNGTTWTHSGAFLGELILDKNDKLLTAYVAAQEVGGGIPPCGLYVSQGGVGLPRLADTTQSTTIQLEVNSANRPIVAHTIGCTNIREDVEPAKQDLVVRRWSGSSWQTLGGVVDKLANRGASAKGIVLDSSNTVYVLFTQCFSYSGTTCANFNLYLSKYVP